MHAHAVSPISQQNICDATDISYKSSSLGIPNPIVNISELSSDDKENLLDQIDSLKQEIIMKFITLQAELIKSLKMLITPTQLAQTLKAYTCSMTNSAETMSSAATLFQDHEDKLIAAKEIEHIFIVITPYLTYFNYELIEVIARVHGADKDKQNMQQYHNDFSEYCKKMPCVEFHEKCNESKQTKLNFKLDYDRNVLKLGDVKTIQRRIAKILNVKASVLCLHCIEDGCMSLTFLVPTFFVDCLLDLITNNMLVLQENVKLLSICVVHDHHDSPVMVGI